MIIKYSEISPTVFSLHWKEWKMFANSAIVHTCVLQVVNKSQGWWWAIMVYSNYCKLNVLHCMQLVCAAVCTVCVSPAWLWRSWPGVISATTAVSWTTRSWPFPGRGSRHWPPGRMKFCSQLVGSGLWPPSLGTVGGKCCTLTGRGYGMGVLAWVPRT